MKLLGKLVAFSEEPLPVAAGRRWCWGPVLFCCGGLGTFAVRDTSASRHNGGPVKGLLQTPKWDSAVVVRGVSAVVVLGVFQGGLNWFLWCQKTPVSRTAMRVLLCLQPGCGRESFVGAPWQASKLPLLTFRIFFCVQFEVSILEKIGWIYGIVIDLWSFFQQTIGKNSSLNLRFQTRSMTYIFLPSNWYKSKAN